MKVYNGYLDEVTGNAVSGWAFRADSPDAHVTVSLYIDNAFVTESVCEIFRIDLKNAGIGAGDHAFRINVPPEYLDGGEHAVDVRFKSGESLNASPRNFLLGYASPAPAAAPAAILSAPPQESFIKETISKAFNKTFYLAVYEDIIAAGIDPLDHYVSTGWKERRDPCPEFSTDYYLETHSDVRDSGVHPFYHYIVTGRKKGYSVQDSSMPFVALEVREQTPAAWEGPADPLAMAAALAALRLIDRDWYLATNPDLQSTEMDPVQHYILYGDQEGRKPNPYFDPCWYAKKYFKHVPAEGCLVHYFKTGEREGKKPCAVFDPTWYAAKYDVNIHEENVLAHYLRHRASNRYAPNEYFSPAYYLNAYEDIAAANIDAFEHWLKWGIYEKRKASEHFNAELVWQRYMGGNRHRNAFEVFMDIGRELGWQCSTEDGKPTVHTEIRKYCSEGVLYEDLQPIKTARPASAKVIAYYLPQFHPIAENDAWWGAGFTEWRNIPRGVPRFVGHYQPRVPRDLGYYELEGTEVMKRQVDLARKMGVHGFCFYYYNFNGRRLLEKPLDAFVADAAIDFPFCIMWANENWTRRWDGMENDVLVRQDYNNEDRNALIDDLAKYLTHPNYIKADGRPVLYLYRADIIPECRDTIRQWRRAFLARHGIDPIIVMAQTFNCNDPNKFGFDGAVEFPPHKLGATLPLLNDTLEMLDFSFQGNVSDYQAIIDTALSEEPNDFPLIKTAFPSWDNDARKQGSGLCFHNSTPHAFERWMRGLIDIARKKPFFGEQFVFVNAWNEWCEGAYLEPDCHYGYAYLNALARSVYDVSLASGKEKIVLVGHDAFPAGAQQLLLNIGHVLTDRFGSQISFVLMRDGEMASSYEKLADTYVVSRHDDPYSKLEDHILALKDRGFSHVVTNSLLSGTAAHMFAERGFRVCSLIHELPTIVREHAVESLYAAICNHSHTVVFPNHFVRKEITGAFGAPHHETVVRPQGLYKQLAAPKDARARIRKELGLKASDRIVINVGYGDIRKGVDVFAAIADKIAVTHDDIHFVWLGDHHPGVISWIQRDVERRSNTQIHFIPFNPEVGTYLAASDLFFLSSREDPFPSVVLEALALGLPVAAFDWGGGYVELLNDAQLGFHIPYMDVEAAARLIPAALNDPKTRAPSRVKYRQALMAERYQFPDYCADILSYVNPERKRVSVVVPNYNYAKYLHERLQSIFDQSYPVYEIIVLDDASHDDSAAVALSAAEAQGKVVRLEINERNSGNVFKQWKRGLEMASGEYLWIAEADDLAHPDFLAEMIRRISASLDSGFAFSDSVAIDERGGVMYDDYKGYYSADGDHGLDQDGSFNAPEFLRRFLSLRNLVLNASSVLWRTEHLRAVFDSLGAEAFSYTCAGDWRIYVESCRLGGSVHYAAQTLNRHRRHDSSVTHALAKPEHFQEIASVQAAALQSFPKDKALSAAVERMQMELRKTWNISDSPVRAKYKGQNAATVVEKLVTKAAKKSTVPRKAAAERKRDRKIG